MTLECGAHNTGYCKPDVVSCSPEGECCVQVLFFFRCFLFGAFLCSLGSSSALFLTDNFVCLGSRGWGKHLPQHGGDAGAGQLFNILYMFCLVLCFVLFCVLLFAANAMLVNCCKLSWKRLSQVCKDGEEAGLQFQLSKDAGRYLCDFVYYRFETWQTFKNWFIVLLPFSPLGLSTAAQAGLCSSTCLRLTSRTRPTSLQRPLCWSWSR